MIIRKVFFVFATFVATTLACLIFVGCSDDVKMSLTVERINLTVGESRDISRYVVYSPFTTENVGVTLFSKSENIEIDGTRVTALAEGSADVTVKTKYGSAQLTVSVVGAYVGDLQIAVKSGDAVQTVDSGESPEKIVFEAISQRPLNENKTVEWSVNGAHAAVGLQFEFTPTGYGEFTVTAEVGSIIAATTVKIYRDTDVVTRVEGNLNQTDGDFSPVRFTAIESADLRNPTSVFVWLVNDAPKGNGMKFEFTPETDGEHKIKLLVNGKDRLISGGDSVTVMAEGRRAPRGEVVFDDRDGVRIEWQDKSKIMRVTIITRDGERQDISATDARHAYRFAAGSFNADELIEVFSSEPKEYTVILTAEEQRAFTFVQYPIVAKEYFEKKVLCRNSFISDVTDGRKFIEELYACGIKEAKCYIGRNATGCLESMNSAAERLGLNAQITESGNVATVRFSDYENEPTEYDSGESERMYSVIPHIEYDKNKLRASSYVFELDRIKSSAVVSRSEELLSVALFGVRPSPKSHSTAEKIYTEVRNKLLSIIGANYTDEQKVHAIYDWLQWVCVRADNPKKYGSGSYLESVFGSADISAPSIGFVRSAVTSEGCAKAFALMCATEGIGCIIERMQKDGKPYFWNKVEIGGLWYNVDVYGGIETSAEIGIARSSELTSHRGLMLDDIAARRMGLNPTGGEFEAIDGGKTVYSHKRVSGAAYFDNYIGANECDDYASIKAAVFDSFSRVTLGSFSVPVFNGTYLAMNSIFGAEFMLEYNLNETQRQSVIGLIIKAADEYAINKFGQPFSDGVLNVYVAGNSLHVVALSPRNTLAEEAKERENKCV